MKNEKFWNEYFRGLEDHSFCGNTVIRATLLAEDLIPAFMELLSSFDPEKTEEIKKAFPELEKELKSLEDGNKTAFWQSEETNYILESLFDKLDSFSPEGFYFGANEGDLSDFGYWLTEEMYEVYYNNNWL